MTGDRYDELLKRFPEKVRNSPAMRSLIEAHEADLATEEENRKERAEDEPEE